MPAGSLIIGVDLAPIKAIPRVISFQSDITTDKCRATIRQHIKHLKCDTVLHDGAPNVGVAWVQDAFSQAELVLQSMKLATEFLKEGGTFVTKVFRSKDYNALLWVFKQLFTTVEATKPPSSRNVSAEIFVVCRGFKAPKRLDPKFLDPKHVFAELQAPTPNNEAKVFNPEKKKRKREGYEEGEYTQHKEVPVSEFIHTTDPIAILGTVNKLSFEQTDNGDLALATLDRLPETTAEIRLCCADLKVLGKKEFRSLLRWRLKIRDKFGMSSKALKAQAEQDSTPRDKDGEGDEVAEVEPMDEELKIQEELQRIRDMGTKEKKKERRKENEQKRKEIVRMQMHMTTPHDIGLEQQGPAGEGSMFQIKSAEKAQDPTRISTGRMEDVDHLESDDSEVEDKDEDSDDDGDRLERELDAMYESFQEKRQENDAKARAKKARKEKETDEWGGLSDEEDKEGGGETDGEWDAESEYGMHQLPTAEGLSTKAAMFFDQDIFQDLGIEEEQEDNDSAIELEDESSDQSAAKLAPTKKTKPTATATATSKPLKSALKQSGKSAAEESESEDEGVIPSATIPSSRPEDPLLPNGQLDVDIITAEAMTLAQSLATKKIKPSDLVDDSFNKYTLRDTDGLPEWFVDDEQYHSKPHRPISAAGAAAIKEKLRALNARPIKKVMEAKGRKKMRAAARLEKLKKKSALLMEDEGVSEKDKVGMIERMIKRATKKGKPKEKVKLVVARGGNRGIAGRPRGVKGKYKIVDPRLKKDVRAEKRLKRKLKK